MSRQARSNIFWSAVRNWGTRLGGVAIFFVAARVLSPHELGLFSAVLAIIMLADLFAENGLGDAVIQAREIDDHVLTAVLLINLAIGSALALALFLLAPQIEAWLRVDGLAPLLSVTVVALVFNSASYVPQSLFRRRFEYRWLAMRGLVGTMIGGVVGVTLALSGFGAWSLVAQTVLTAISNCLLVWLKPPFSPFVRLDFRGAGKIVRFGFHLLVNRVLYYFSTRAIELVIVWKYNASSLALYVMGARLYAVAAQMIMAVMVDVAFSSFSRLAEDLPALRAAFFSSLRTASVVAVPIFLGMSALAPELCTVAFGNERGEASAPYLSIVAAFGSLTVTQFFNGIVLSALGRPAISTRVMVLQSGLSALVLLPPWPLGPLWLVLLSSATLLVVFPIYLRLFTKVAGISAWEVLRLVMPVYLAGGLMVAAIVLLRAEIEPLVSSPFFRGAVLGAVGGAVYVAVLAVAAPTAIMWLLRQYRGAAA